MSPKLDNLQKKHADYFKVEAKELPFHCPPKSAQQWSMHPKVFLQFNQDGSASCPYCGASYRLQVNLKTG